ncbi:hypothetical protein RUM43_014561 [Polyplax serrata]|uniref:Ubiquitin-like domain-containing protein n=1 Tax=Polyplax serrata TaxID=468196 RepID=A0AAN8P3Y4_POLSC
MIEIPVKLIVKAPNQQFEDQTIHCSLTWTIKRLKGYLSEVYPSKPNTEDQRLIYYGQLLNDSVTLKDIFTRYEAGEETHTVHLVCMPSKETLKMQARKIAEESSKKAKEASTTGSSTSHRLSVNEDEILLGERQGESSQTMGRGYFQPVNYHNWMNGIHSQASAPNNYLQQWAWMQQIYAHYYLTQYMDMLARQNGYTERRQTEAPNIPEPQVAHDADDEENRRDWLDYFYILSRLYQIGLLRINQIQGLDNNNEAVNNNIPVDNNNDGHEGVVGDVQRAEDTPGQAAPDLPIIRENVEPPSFAALTWTFVTSFFSSIIPETQNAL